MISEGLGKIIPEAHRELGQLLFPLKRMANFIINVALDRVLKRILPKYEVKLALD